MRYNFGGILFWAGIAIVSYTLGGSMALGIALIACGLFSALV